MAQVRAMLLLLGVEECHEDFTQENALFCIDLDGIIIGKLWELPSSPKTKNFFGVALSHYDLFSHSRTYWLLVNMDNAIQIFFCR